MRSFPAPAPAFAGSPNKGAFEAQQANRTAHQNMLKGGRRTRRTRRSRQRRRRTRGGAVPVPQFDNNNNSNANNLVVQAAGHQLNADNLSNALSNTGKPKIGGRKTRKFKFFFS